MPIVISGITATPTPPPSARVAATWDVLLLTRSVSSLSTQACKVVVRSNRSGAQYDPTSDTVEMAITTPGAKPVDDDWHIAEWETDDSTPAIPVHIAQIIVGPAPGADVAVGPGVYGVWVRITDNPDTPVIEAGRLTVA